MRHHYTILRYSHILEAHVCVDSYGNEVYLDLSELGMNPHKMEGRTISVSYVEPIVSKPIDLKIES